MKKITFLLMFLGVVGASSAASAYTMWLYPDTSTCSDYNAPWDANWSTCQLESDKYVCVEDEDSGYIQSLRFDDSFDHTIETFTFQNLTFNDDIEEVWLGIKVRNPNAGNSTTKIKIRFGYWHESSQQWFSSSPIYIVLDNTSGYDWYGFDAGYARGDAWTKDEVNTIWYSVECELNSRYATADDGCEVDWIYMAVTLN